MNGNFIISLDFEMLWGLAGWSDDKIAEYSPRVKNSVKALDRILSTLGKYDIKATVAYVGAMRFKCKKELLSFIGDRYPNYSNPVFSSYNSILPLIDTYGDSMFFCPDFISKLSQHPLVELASHTFSHFYCLEEGIEIEDFENDLQLMNTLDNSLKSIIFPRNQINKKMLLLCEKYGFTHYRGKNEFCIYKTTKSESKYTYKGALRLLDAYIPVSGTQSFSLDASSSKIRNIPESCFLRPYSKSIAFLEPLRKRRILRGMEFAAKNNQNYHLWWHPHNFGSDLDENIEMLESICNKYAELSSKYKFQTKFMCEL